MAEGNWTSVGEFILMSFSSLPTEIQSLLFLTFLIIYLVTLMGNSLIILVTLADPMLHSPMYFFLRNLSFLEIGFNLVIVPKMLATLLARDTTISFLGCATQMYFFFLFGVAECVLLATMAYDRYVAICNPLHYPVIMNQRTRAKLAIASWFPGFPIATLGIHSVSMAEGNWTRVGEFILMSFSSLPTEIRSLLFLTFLIIYLVTLMGNSLIILVTLADPMLHSPMYFFLRNLSFLEIGFNLVIVPKMLATLLARDTTISFLGCATQMYFFFLFGVAECVLLATMAYDRYVAICNPLHYPVIMNQRTRAKLAIASWFPGFPMATVQTTWLFSFPFCGTNKVNHFFCDSPPVLKLVCADTALFEIYAIVGTVLVVMIPCLLILCSYTRIAAAILKIPSAKGKHKAFSTCSSHL
ncbi:O10A5 protein, partial [Crocuta crocuta]